MSDITVMKVLKFHESPDAGEDCICSLCREPIHITAVRCFGSKNEHGFEMRFHWECYKEFQHLKICEFEWGD